MPFFSRVVQRHCTMKIIQRTFFIGLLAFLLPATAFSTDLSIPAYCSTIRDMIEAPHGNIWFGTFGGGLWKVTPGKNSKFNGPTENLPFPMISNLLIDANKLWIATAGGGCVCMDLATEKFLNVAQLEGFERLHGLIKTSRNDILIGSVGSGTAILRGKFPDYFWQPVTKRNLQHLSWVNCFAEWADKLWLGTANGLYSTALTDLSDSWAPISAGLNEGVNHIFPLKDVLYISTATRGVFMMKNGKQPIPVRNTYGEIYFVTSFKGRIVAGGKFGLWEIKDGKGREISNFPAETAKSFLITGKNLLLIGTLNGKILQSVDLKEFKPFIKLTEYGPEETTNAK